MPPRTRFRTLLPRDARPRRERQRERHEDCGLGLLEPRKLHVLECGDGAQRPSARIDARQLARDPDADFIANGSPDAAARVTNGSLRLTGNEANLVANGNFSQASSWTWA